MIARRTIYIASLVAIAAFLALFIFLSALSAQPPGEGPPGAPGGPGGGGGGGGLSYSETHADALLEKTYSEYLAEHGLPTQPVPQALLVDDKGEPVTRTDSAWHQLEKLYSRDAEAEAKPSEVPGRVGKVLLRDMQTQLAVIKKENVAMIRAAGAAAGGFTFKVGYPKYEPAGVTSAGATLRIGLIMRVNKSLSQNYGATVYRLLKPYDNYGADRVPFTFVTYQGGYYRPQTFMLHPTSVAIWNSIWATPTVVLVLKDVNGNLIASGSQSAGFTGNIPTLIAYPPEIRRTPAFAYLMPEDDKTFGGGKMNLDYTRGWYYEFTFSLSLENLARMDRASAGIVMPPSQIMLDAVSQAKTYEEILPALQPRLTAWVNEQVQAFGMPKPKPGAAPPPPVAGQEMPVAGAGAPPGGVQQLVPGGVGAGYALPPPVTAGAGVPL